MPLTLRRPRGERFDFGEIGLRSVHKAESCDWSITGFAIKEGVEMSLNQGFSELPPATQAVLLYSVGHWTAQVDPIIRTAVRLK